MSRKQWLILIVLGGVNLMVLCLLGLAVTGVLEGLLPTAPSTASSPLPTATPVPEIPPTWTPIPTATPFVAEAQVLPTSTPRPLTGEEAALFDQVEEDVVTLRGLDLDASPSRQVLTELQLRRRLEARYQSDEMEGRFESLAYALAALDLVEPNIDLQNDLQGLLREQVTGYYNGEQDTVYMVNNADVTALPEQVSYAHQFTHALQDQHYDLTTLDVGTTDQFYDYGDRTLALAALVEGDAEQVQTQYMEEILTREEVIVVQQAYGRMSDARLNAVPPILREAFLFPSTYGREFVAALYEEGGWEMVDGAYLAPPTSSEQILHPERYLAGEQPVSVSLPPLTDTLGADWRMVYRGTVGEFTLQSYLDRYFEGEDAALATEGWGGDQLAVYHSEADGTSLMVLSTVWDTPDDAAEFRAAYVTGAESRFEGPGDTETDSLICWERGDFLCVTWEGQGVSIVQGPNRGIVAPVVGMVP
jgi:hypothetical protein